MRSNKSKTDSYEELMKFFIHYAYLLRAIFDITFHSKNKKKIGYILFFNTQPIH